MFRPLLKQSHVRGLRAFSSTTPSTTSKPRGAGLVQRISSFFIGAGLSALVTQYYILEEIRNGNQNMIEKQRDLEKRLLKLENC